MDVSPCYKKVVKLRPRHSYRLLLSDIFIFLVLCLLVVLLRNTREGLFFVVLATLCTMLYRGLVFFFTVKLEFLIGFWHGRLRAVEQFKRILEEGGIE